MSIYKQHMDFGTAFKSPYDKMLRIPVVVSGAHQTSRIIINEDGGEVASVSDIELIFTASPNGSTSKTKASFRADHPFIFYITEESTGAILFMGLMTN